MQRAIIGGSRVMKPEGGISPEEKRFRVINYLIRRCEEKEH
jgi:hypothetical protein